MLGASHTHHHRQIVWLDDKPEEVSLDSDAVESFIARLVELVKQLGQKGK